VLALAWLAWFAWAEVPLYEPPRRGPAEMRVELTLPSHGAHAPSRRKLEGAAGVLVERVSPATLVFRHVGFAPPRRAGVESDP
jgi:hypothetical protein